MGRVTNASEDVFLVSKIKYIKKKSVLGGQEGKAATTGFVLEACEGIPHSVCPSTHPEPRIALLLSLTPFPKGSRGSSYCNLVEFGYLAPFLASFLHF